MKNLQNFSVKELNAREIKEIDGGGWIADFVANIVGRVKCGCNVRPFRSHIEEIGMYN